VAVARLDFDAFRSVNEAHGTVLGDLVLQQLAERLRRALRRTDLVVRLDADDFVLVLEDIHRLENLAPLLERLQLDLDVPYTLSDTLLWQCPISMGITLYPDDNVDAQGLLRHAERALGEVKANKTQRERFWGVYGQ
jgi:diguanylate cyclase (GGDEF)-like protein